MSEYAPVVKELETDILEVEATVFSGAVAPTERIYSLRRQATGFYRIVHPLMAVVTTVTRTIAPPELRPYLVDVEDDLVLASEDVAAQRDLLSTVLEANLAMISVEQTKVSVRQNATIEQLTILATVFLPLTFVTGKSLTVASTRYGRAILFLIAAAIGVLVLTSVYRGARRWLHGDTHLVNEEADPPGSVVTGTSDALHPTEAPDDLADARRWVDDA